MKRLKVSNNVIRRMPRYLRKLDELTENGISRISSFELGHQLGLTPSQIRQDFSCFGEFGPRLPCNPDRRGQHRPRPDGELLLYRLGL